MKIKRLVGLCEYPGCKRFAKRSLIIKTKNEKIKEIHVCEECAWHIRMNT